MRSRRNLRKANAGVARILETVIAATIILVAFTAASFFISSSRTAVVQDRTDLDRLGYNVLNRLTESGTIEATIESSTISDAQNQLRAFVQNALPSSVLFNLTVSNCVEETPSDWVAVDQLATVSNTDGTSFSGSLAVSSTPMIFTSKNDNIYYLVLTLANPGEGTQ